MDRYTLPHTFVVPWMEPQLEQTSQPLHDGEDEEEDIAIAMGAPLTCFKSMLEPEPEPEPGCYINSTISINPPQQSRASSSSSVPFVPNPTTDNFLMHNHHNINMDSFALDPPSSLSHPFFNNNNISNSTNNPFDTSFDLGPNSGFFQSSNSPLLMGFPQPQMGTLDPQFPTGLELEPFGGSASGHALFPNRAKALRPLEVAQSTLFQKRVALRRGSSGTEKKRRRGEEAEVEEGSVGIDVDGSGLNYDSDDVHEDGNPDGTVNGGDQKGKKKGLPAKNLMAERRRRKKLNDRLYMLRSVVPKISKV